LPGIFISYRREDSEDSTRALSESLVPKFGKDRVFLDVEAIKPGSDFRDSIEESLADCGVFLVVIGPTWASIKPDHDPSGPRRLDSPRDFVRQELATALKKGNRLPVILALVRGASMPAADQLPDDLKDLAYRNAIVFNNLNWDANVSKLIDTVRPQVGEREVPRQQVGQFRSGANGSNPLQFHVTAREHHFKFSDAQAKSPCGGTFSVSAAQTKFTPRMRDGRTACGLDAVLGGS